MFLFFFVLLAVLPLVPPAHAQDYGSSYGSTPTWAQPEHTHEPGEPFRGANPYAGYEGSNLPPSDYNPDAPRYDRTAPMPPLDAGQFSQRYRVETPSGSVVCRPAGYVGNPRVVCD